MGIIKNIFGSTNFPTTSSPPIMEQKNIPTREERKQMEESTKNIPILGDIIKASNRLCDTSENASDAINPIKITERLIKSGEELTRGDHIITQRIGYTHHGIYIGINNVIHYEDGIVKKDSIENFKKGSTISTLSNFDSHVKYSVNEIISRANSRIGEEKYNLVFNNCEQFARWCRNDD